MKYIEDGVHLEYRPLSELQRWPCNPLARELGATRDDLGRFNLVVPILLDERSGELVAGYGQIEALVRLKARGENPPARVKVRDEEWLAPVIRGVTFADDSALETYLVEYWLRWVK